MAKVPWMTNIFFSSVYFCRQHFYKILVVVVFILLATQYSLNVFFYQTNTYFSFNSSLFNSAQSLKTTKSVEVTTTTVVPPAVTLATLETEKMKSAALIGEPMNDLVNGSSSLNVSRKRVSTGQSEAVALDRRQLLAKNGSSSQRPSSFETLPLCPLVPPKLVGALKVWADAPSLDELEKSHPELELGGRFRPKECQSRHRVAIIIPFRDREEHLRMFLHNMHPMLQRQQLDYGIYVVEQVAKTRFNRAMLMNIGYVESLKQHDYQCFIFHDVDLIPEDDRNIYSCPAQPRHMSVAIDVFNYKLPYEPIFGGVCALNKTHMNKVNGFSNLFWGWGGEDDDMSNRVHASGYHISRYPANIARYKMLKHKKQEPNPDRYNVLYKGKRRFKNDGLNTLKYTRRDILLKRLYTWILVDLKKK